jgi:integrase
MISVSFYLLTPDALSQSQVYVSISNKENRLRFPTGESFIASYCNIRKKKGGKELVRRNTEFHFEYKSKLNELRDMLIRIEMNLTEGLNKPSLEQVRDAFYLKTGKVESSPQLNLADVFNKFIAVNESLWSAGTRKHFTTIQNHLIEYESAFKPITLQNITEDTWNSLRDDYFVETKQYGNGTINSNLKKLKQFLKFADKKGYLKNKMDFEELKFLTEIEPFKIALKEGEVETLLNLDLSDQPRLDKVRDLFALEIMTGQRFSDMAKVIDRKHISETNIQIYQQKTNEKVTIPIHSKLKKHLAYIFNKYPAGLPSISNQNFNDYLKEVCIKAKFNKEHSWITLSGLKKIKHSDFRYNLISSHTGRRTFCTLALKSGINPEIIMKVTGHKKYDQFREYVKVDDDDIDNAFEGMFKTEKKFKNK